MKTKLVNGIEYLELVNKPTLEVPGKVLINQKPFYDKFLNKKRRKK